MDRRVSLMAITRDNGDSPSSSGWNVTREATWMASNVLIDTFSRKSVEADGDNRSRYSYLSSAEKKTSIASLQDVMRNLERLKRLAFACFLVPHA